MISEASACADIGLNRATETQSHRENPHALCLCDSVACWNDRVTLDPYVAWSSGNRHDLTPVAVARLARPRFRRDARGAKADSHARRDERHHRASVEAHRPASRLFVEQRANPAADDRRHALGRVQHGVVRRGVAGAKVVGGRGREERVDLAPREVHEDQREREPGAGDRPTATTRNRHTACRRNAMIIVVSLPRRSDAQPQKIRLAPLARGPSVAASVRAAAVKPPRPRHRSGVRRHQEAARRHQHEHRVHHVELRRAQHLAGREVALAQLRDAGGGRHRQPRPAGRADVSGTARR